MPIDLTGSVVGGVKVTRGEKLKYARTTRDLTLQELSDKSGLSVSFLSDVEQGRSGMSVKSIEKVCKALRIDPIFFLDEKATTIQEIAQVSGFNLPDDLLKFVSKEESLPYVMLAKKLGEEGIPLNVLEMILSSYKAGKKQ